MASHSALVPEPAPRLTAADRAARLIATAGGLGYVPLAPGTAASLAPAALVWLLAPGDGWLVAAALVVTAIGLWAAGHEARRQRDPDPTSIVVDEVAGMLVTLVAVPRTWGWVLLAFVLFRVMDVWKPPPIFQLQALHGGFGIVVDDLLAGVYANLVVQAAWLAWSWAR